MNKFEILKVTYLHRGGGIKIKTNGIYNNDRLYWNIDINNDKFSWKNNNLSVYGIPYEDGINYLTRKDKQAIMMMELFETFLKSHNEDQTPNK